MRKLKIVLEVEVDDVHADEQIECGIDAEDTTTAGDYAIDEIAGIFNCDTPDMWGELMAGSDVWVSFNRVSVLSAEELEQ